MTFAGARCEWEYISSRIDTSREAGYELVGDRYRQ